MSNVEWTAHLYPACWWASWLWPWGSGVHSGTIRAAVSWWTWGVIGFPEWRSLPFALTSSSSQPVVSSELSRSLSALFSLY